MEVDKVEAEKTVEKPSEVVCTFCMKATCQDFANVQQKRDLLELLDKLSVEIEPIKGHIDWICYQCTYKLNCIRDYARTWTACIVKNRINYYYSLGDKDMVRRLLNIKKPKPLRRSCSVDNAESVDSSTDHPSTSQQDQNDIELKISSVRSIGANDMPKPTIASTATTTTTNTTTSKSTTTTTSTDEQNDSSTRSVRSVRSNTTGGTGTELLSVMYEHSESVLVTESGGRINGYRRKKNDRNTPSILKCKTCHRIYKKLSFLKKHERKHERDFLKSNMPTRGPVTITCSDCNIVFNSLATWRAHYKIHQARMKCSYCPAEFILKADFEMHEAICYGMLCARDESQQTGRYLTRSAGRRRNRPNPEPDDALSVADTMYTRRIQNARDWVTQQQTEQTTAGDTTNEIIDLDSVLPANEDDDDSQSLATTFSRTSSNSRITKSYVYAEEDDDLSTLTAASAPSKTTIGPRKRRKPNDHIETPKKRTRRSISNAFDDAFQLLECPDRNCNFVTTSLLRLQEHDLTVHDELPLFPCKACKGQFLRRCYLERHLICQNYGRFVCNKCERVFHFEQELKSHFNDHNIAEIKRTAHYCEHCTLSFLKESELKAHQITPRHFEKKAARKSIFIVKTTNPPLGSLMNSNNATTPTPTTSSATTESADVPEQQSTKKINPKPYKSEIRIRKYLKPLLRRQQVVFRRWKPGKDPKRLNGFNFPNCAAKQYKYLNLLK